MNDKGPNTSSTEVRARIVAFVPRLRRFCHALATTADLGDDLLQQTVERALSRIEQWQPGTSLESWMFRIARNIQIDAVRARQVRGIVVDLDDVADGLSEDGVRLVETRSELAAVRRAMAALPLDQQELIAVVIIDGQSYKDAAEILGIPIGNVMSRLARARRAIEASLRRGEEALQ